jgi:hypothetical protein
MAQRTRDTSFGPILVPRWPTFVEVVEICKKKKISRIEKRTQKNIPVGSRRNASRAHLSPSPAVVIVVIVVVVVDVDVVGVVGVVVVVVIVVS